MPFFSYRCKKCGVIEKKLMPQKTEAPPETHCECKDEREWVFGEPTSQVKEVLDNGIMVKKLERLVNAEELTTERKKAYKPKDGKLI